MFAAEGYRGLDIISVFWEDNADGDLAVVGAVGGVEGLCAVVEADIARDFSAEGSLK
jgi:hypothetical protein